METHAPAEQLSAQQTAPTGEPERVPEPSPRLVPRARWRRFFGWFWCSAAFAQARAALAEESEARRRYRTRARTARDFAERACEPQLRDGGTNPDAWRVNSIGNRCIGRCGTEGEDTRASARLEAAARPGRTRAARQGDAASNASPCGAARKGGFVDLSQRTEPNIAATLRDARDVRALAAVLERPAEHTRRALDPPADPGWRDLFRARLASSRGSTLRDLLSNSRISR